MGGCMETTNVRWVVSKQWREDNWGQGPWMDEPDEVYFESHNLPCCLLRNRRTGTWCGYVGVTHDHWAAVEDFNALTRYLDETAEGRRMYPHGGITYSSPLLLNASVLVDPKMWWLGFDAAHAGDLIPMHVRCGTFGTPPDIYRDATYMKAECARLAEGLTTLPPPTAPA